MDIGLSEKQTIEYALPVKTIVAGLFAGCLTLVFVNSGFAQGTDFHEQQFNAKDFTGQKLDGANFTDAVLKGCNFTHASLRNAKFTGADLSGAWLNDADLTGADLTKTTGDYIASRTCFDGATLQGQRITMNNCTFRKANLRDTKVSGYIYNCDFSGADFSGANLRLMAVNTDSNKWKGVIYDDDTSWPDGFDPVKVGAILKSSSTSAAQKPAMDSAPVAPASVPATADSSSESVPPAIAPPADPSKSKKSVNPFKSKKSAASVAGKYIGETNKQAWCQLNEDGTMVFAEGSDETKGTYTADGNDITMTIDGQTIKTKIEGNVMLPPGGDGQKLIKQGDAATGPTLVGKYVGEKHPNSSCVFKADGTLVFHEGGQDMQGTYKIDGDTVTLSVSGETMQAKIVGNALVPDGHAEKLIKQ